MKIKFSKYERVAGLFVVIALGGALLSTVFIAVKRGWFASKIQYATTFERAQGVFIGTRVEVSGLSAGSVDSVERQPDNRVLIKFSVLEKFAARLKQGTVVITKRPFIIGDKIIELIVDKAEGERLMAGSQIPSENTIDLMEMMDGRKMAPYLETMGQVVENLKVVAEAFLDPERSKNMVAMFDQINPLLKNLNVMSRSVTDLSGQLTRKKNIQTAVENLAMVSSEMTNMMKEMPNMGRDMAGLVENTSHIVAELNKILPAMGEIAPEFPKATRRAIEAIDEAVVVLKAMQKSFLLSGKVADVREEEEKRKKEEALKSQPPPSEATPAREPAGENP